MSMNLNASVDGKEIRLWQLSSQMSYTIFGNDSLKDKTGQEAKRVIERYRMYVKYSINGVYHSKEDLDLQKEVVADHLKYIDSCMNGELRVWVM